jgi:hypothetical protein
MPTKEEYSRNPEKHKAQRRDSYKRNKQKETERARKWQSENHDKHLQIKRDYYECNKEEILRKNKEYRKKNKEKILLQKRLAYEKDKAKQREREQIYFSMWLPIIENHYGGIACQVCGYDKNFAALDFHHRNPKEKVMQIATILIRRPNDELVEEMEKCDLLCRNCHAELHFPNKDINLLLNED